MIHNQLHNKTPMSIKELNLKQYINKKTLFWAAIIKVIIYAITFFVIFGGRLAEAYFT